ncbi:helix-turn-helix domain-containing protein [Aquincola tertiaricarbonis]|uniref:Helix-turn-helix domain-containing protein n=1 Tax=Aquincola tertiaricarbonis TaxID=391953 RepID=A0ABY4S8C0_AQUTE|nr:helix-turn-helix domain-containing protein [Aquincola tertiaricarbonis]URI07499.1 helix-turn-helix domain-containing protein [Aquincola tertiaricarbonis]
MNVPLISVLQAGIAIRTLRKRAGIRIDDFALTAGVSKQFLTDLENGKATVQMGKVLDLLQRLGVKVTMEMAPEDTLDYQKRLMAAEQRKTARDAQGSSSKSDPSSADADD